MPMAMKLEDAQCPHCGEEELYWYSKDETETVYELYLNCDYERGCGYEFPKLIVNKSEDTSDGAFEKRLRDRYAD